MHSVSSGASRYVDLTVPASITHRGVMKKTLMPAIAVLLAAGSVVLPVTASDAATATAVAAGYDNCTDLNRVYHHGVSNRHLTRHQWIKRGASGKGAYKPRLYKRVHNSLDRDDDHIACEN